MSTINLDLDADKAETVADSFDSKEPMPNIWTIADPDEDNDMDKLKDSSVPPPASVPYDDPADDKPFVGGADDELEKPSFLRRLTKRKKDPTDI